jgi:hypothetical protein
VGHLFAPRHEARTGTTTHDIGLQAVPIRIPIHG